MERQEAFNKAAQHLLSTGVPSGIAKGHYFSCQYGGSGCALRPFIPKDADIEKWDSIGSIGEMPRELLPDFISADLNFYEDLQSAHDDTAQVTLNTDTEWLPSWKEEMRKLAKVYNLDASIIDTPTQED